jgi:hypothetical protein
MIIKVVATVVTGAALLAAASAAAQDDGSLQGLDDGPPACSLAVTTPSGAPPAPRGAVAWVQCNFHVTHLTLRSNARVAKVRRRPRLYGAEAGDRLACERTARRRAGCTGSLDSFTRPRIRLRLGRPTCSDPVLRVRVTATGGLDCPPHEACPAIGLITRARSEGALGCA